MRIKGKLTKSGNWWAVEIPLLLIYSQGKTKREAFEMAKDAVECLLDDSTEVSVSDIGNNAFCISATNETALMSLALKQQRTSHDLTIREVATRLGSKSPTAYSRYERGNTRPSLDKFSKLLCAIDPKLDPVITVA